MTIAKSPIRTPDQRLRVFVSSTLQELAESGSQQGRDPADPPHAGDVRDARARTRRATVSRLPGAERRLRRNLLAALRVGRTNETVSGLEDEYHLARQIPKLIYIKHADAREDRLTGLLDRIQQEDKVCYRHFADAPELQQLVANDLALMLTERFVAGSTDGGAAGRGAHTGGAAAQPSSARARRSHRPGLTGRARGRAAWPARSRPDHLTGPGGTGKTRLGVHSETPWPAFADGVFYVPLRRRFASRRGARHRPHSSSRRRPSGADPENLLLGFLRARRALLVLDNFEQVLDAAGDVRGCSPRART